MTAVYDPIEALITLKHSSQEPAIKIWADNSRSYFNFFFDCIKKAAMDEYLAINGGCGSDSPEIIPGKEYEI